LPLATPNKKTSKRKKGPALPERFLELGRKHFANDFPNPTRLGCPPKDALRGLAFEPRKTEASTLDHVGLCSPCYRIFSRYLRQVKTKKASLKGKIR
jgi:hypothetical protein